MGIRHWIRKRLAEQAEDGDDGVAPSGSIINSIFGREPPTLHALGEYDQRTYPGELQDLLRRREDVAEEIREMDLTTRQARVEAIPRLQSMLRTYPHPLAYETLIHAYVDAGRWDEARGAAFAARERRVQVIRSPYSEIRCEVDRLKEWSPDEIELLRQEREGTAAPAAPPVQRAAPAEPARPVERVEPVAAAAPIAVPEPVVHVEPVASARPLEAAGPMDSIDAADLPGRGDSAQSFDPDQSSAAVEVREFADPVDAADPANLEEPMYAGDAAGSADLMDEDDAESSEPADSPGGMTASGGAGGAAPRPNGKGGSRKARRKGNSRRRK